MAKYSPPQNPSDDMHPYLTDISAVKIGKHKIGPGHPVFVVAELSANHRQQFDEAVRLIEAAKEAGADAVKLQTYTPDTMTIDCDDERFRHRKGSLWEGQTLYDLYQKAYMPWDWQPKLKKIANELELELFSSAYDNSSVAFLESMDIPAYKISSFELIDLPLIRRVAITGKPLILSTGMATAAEIEQAVTAARSAGSKEIVLLKCTSAYPAHASDMNLRSLEHLGRTYDLPCGLSDHSQGIIASVAATVLGACMIEKHFTLSRQNKSADCGFSLEPHEFKAMVDAVREAQTVLGNVHYGPSDREKESVSFRRSIYAIEDINAGGTISAANVATIRPAGGLSPDHWDSLMGKRTVHFVPKGTPITWDAVNKPEHVAIKAIVFDLDDTLYPQIAFKRSGFAVVSRWVSENCNRKRSVVSSHLEDILKNYGPSYPYMFDRLVEQLQLKRNVIAEIVRVFIEHRPKIQCYRGVRTMLAEMRKYYHLGILTDGRYSVQEKKISALELENKVDSILCSDRLGLSKPASELFQWFEEKFNLNGRNMMYVGDNPKKDFYGGNKRDWTTVRVMTGENRDIKCKANFKPRFEIDSINSLEALLLTLRKCESLK
jgi:N-acetylneuraminate synthase